MVAGRDLLARQHDIAERRRIGLDAHIALAPEKRGRLRQRCADIEPQRVIGRAVAPRGAFRRAEMPASARVGRTHFILRRAAGAGDLGLDLPPGAEAGIEQPRGFELRQGRAVIVGMLGLAAYRSVPIKPEPPQILDDRADVFRAAAGMVDVFDAQQKTPARLARRPPPLQCRPHMPQMQIPGRARRKSRDHVGAHRAHPRHCE